MQRQLATGLLVVIALALGGCASMKSHDESTAKVQAAARSGGVAAALAQHESSAKSPEERAELLFNMERGELLRLNKRYEESSQAFQTADAKVREWEETAKTNPSKLLGLAGAALISERLKVYEGQDYEKVWLSTRLALNHVARGDMDGARVEVKRTHEREAVISELRAKSTAAAEEEAKSKGAQAQGKELNGYPVETLNDPEVLALKNGYQNALSHYLAGFLYEVLNEPGLAAPGYRKAIELQPERAVLEEGLRGLDDRSSFTHKRRQRMTDVLFVVEAGSAPARKPRAFTIPVPTGKSVRTVSVSYPVIEPSKDPLLSMLESGGLQFKLEPVVDLNLMARRSLKDEMPGMVLRNVTRAVAKAAVQEQLEKKGGMLGSLVGIVGSAVTEQADDRIWRSLPGRVYVARGYLPPGEHQLSINGRPLGAPIKVDGQYALVPLRLYEDQFLAGDVASHGRLPLVAAAPQPEPEPAAQALVPAKAEAKPAGAARKPARKPATTTAKTAVSKTSQPQ
jgi:hypothetical protein